MNKYIFLFLSLFLFLVFMPAANARIDIVPQKIIIGPRDRGGEVTILNLYDQKATFRMELLNFKQDEDGVYQELNEPLDPRFDPEQIIRFSPRQFSISKGGRQTIRLSVRKPADLPEGEYRFHLKALRLMEQDQLKVDDGAIQVIMNMGVTIPVIVRHGNVSATAKLGQLQIIEGVKTKRGKPELHIPITREGNASTIGILEVLWQPNGGETRLIGEISNMNIFTEVTTRNVVVPLREMPYGAGKLAIRYIDAMDKGKIFDEITIQR